MNIKLKVLNWTHVGFLQLQIKINDKEYLHIISQTVHICFNKVPLTLMGIP